MWHFEAMTYRPLAFLALLALTPSLSAHNPSPVTAEERYALIQSWEGRWEVEEIDSLQIVFEKTAKGHTMIERWETASGLHSMTVYHLDDDLIIATHYCPQGNQPRLQAGSGTLGHIDFDFRDVTDLDEGESHAHTLSFTKNSDGSLRRSETYMSGDDLGDPTILTLVRSPEAN